MTIDELSSSAENDPEPPGGLSPELTALWHTKAQHWEAAHSIAQNISTSTGSWIHALLHLIEGDIGNARYWFRIAGKPTKSTAEIEELWREIAADLLN